MKLNQDKSAHTLISILLKRNRKTMTDLAEELGISTTSLARMLSKNHKIKIQTLVGFITAINSQYLTNVRFQKKDIYVVSVSNSSGIVIDAIKIIEK